MSGDRENAERLGKLYLANLLRKLQEGKSLSKKEFKHLKELSSSASPPSEEEKRGEAPSEKEEVGIPQHLRIERHYTMSEKALEQRRRAASKGGKKSKVNAYKHGKYAKSFLHKIKPCHSTCQYYPCEVVAQGGTKPGGVCLDKAAVITSYQAIINAVENKNYKDFNDLAALTIAESIHTIQMLFEDIIRDGTMAKREKYDKEGSLIGYEIVPHPSLLALPKMIADLGITPAEFLITPRSLARADEEEKGARTLADIMSGIGRNLQKKHEDKEDKE
jgi:hypothetical protein